MNYCTQPLPEDKEETRLMEIRKQEQIDRESIPNTGIHTGRLCKECLQDSNCKDKQCPVYTFRKENKCLNALIVV